LKAKKTLKNIYIDVKMSCDSSVFLDDATSNRLKKVMRFKKGWEFAVFNGRDGLFLVEILDSDCKRIQIKEKIKEQEKLTCKTLFLPLLKKEALSNAIRQATELGIDIIQPIITDFTVENNFKHDRYHQIMMGACEQSERLTIPEIKEVLSLKKAIEKFNENIFWANERTDAEDQNRFSESDGVLVGPEGGFSEEEKEFLSQRKNVFSQSLGDTILKADTAVVVAIVKLGV